MSTLPIPIDAAVPVAARRPRRDDGKFFAGALAPAAWVALRDRFPDYCASILDTANAIRSRPGFTRALDRTDPALIADPHRQQWLLRLAQAYALDGDEQRADACFCALEESIAAGAVPDGLRLISWCWTLALAGQSPLLTPVRLAHIAWAVHEGAAALSESTRRLPSSSATAVSDALALCYAGAIFPDFAESRRWQQDAARVLVTECDRQVHPDGVHFEQSTCFQRYVIDVYLHFVVLAARCRMDVPPAVADRVQRMLDFILAIRMPDGTAPSIGDSDGGCLLPLAARSTADSRGRFAVAAALFGRPDYAWAAGGSAPEVAWLLGCDGLRAFDALRPARPSTSPSRVFPSGGYAIMRSGWDRDAHQMIVDIGPLGCPVSGAHGHADLLSIQCSIFGEPVVVDPGTHCYGDSRWRDYFRSTAAHSTVVVDGASQAEPAGSFGWQRRPRVRLREWHSTPDVDFLDAEHDGYMALPAPVVHRRRVIFIKPAYWILVDDLSGTGRHDVELKFQFAGGPVLLGPHPWTRAATTRGQCLWISAFPSAPAQTSLKSGAASPICGWIAPEYTRLSPAPMLIYSFAVALPWRIVTLLLPDRQGLPAPPGVRPIYDAGGLPHGFGFERPRRVVRFSDRAVVVERD